MRRAGRRGLSEVVGGLFVLAMVVTAVAVYSKALNSVVTAGESAIEAAEARAVAGAVSVARVDGGIVVSNGSPRPLRITSLLVNTTDGVSLADYTATLKPGDSVAINDTDQGTVIGVIVDGGVVLLAASQRQEAQDTGGGGDEGGSAQDTLTTTSQAQLRLAIIEDLGYNYKDLFLDNGIDIGMPYEELYGPRRIRVAFQVDFVSAWAVGGILRIRINNTLVYENDYIYVYGDTPQTFTYSDSRTTVIVTIRARSSHAELGVRYADINITIQDLAYNYTGTALIGAADGDVSMDTRVIYRNIYGDRVDIIVWGERHFTAMTTPYTALYNGSLPLYWPPQIFSGAAASISFLKTEGTLVIYETTFEAKLLVVPITGAPPAQPPPGQER